MNFVFHHKCQHCDGPFTKEGEEVYFLNNVILEQSLHDNALHWRWVREDDKVILKTKNGQQEILTNDGITKIEMYFHKECFLAIAGNLYVSKKL